MYRHFTTHDLIKNNLKTSIEATSYGSYIRLLGLSRPDLGIIIIGFTATIVAGIVQGTFSLVISNVVQIFSLCDRGKQEIQVNFYLLVLVVYGCLLFLSTCLQVLFL